MKIFNLFKRMKKRTPQKATATVLREQAPPLKTGGLSSSHTGQCSGSFSSDVPSTTASRFNCREKVDAIEIGFDQVEQVIASWENGVRKFPNWKEVGGELLLRNMFELEPECIEMFDFPPDTQYDDPKLKDDRAFMTKAVVLLLAVDTAVGFLGPDLEPLETQLRELGGRHVALRCKPHHWPVVGEALFHVLHAVLGDKFTPELQQNWITIYNFLGFHMIEGLLANS